MKPNQRLLDDYVTFSRLELQANDIEPWAALLKVLWDSGKLPPEHVAWITTLYNTYDSLSSAWGVYSRWPTPQGWAAAPDREEAARHDLYPRMQERRNLHGESVLKRHGTYASLLGDKTEVAWMASCLELDDPGKDFTRLTEHMRQVWGVGRQAAFEWAEFAGKVFGLPVDAADGQLWDSSGPRKSLELMYGLSLPSTPAILNYLAEETMELLEECGVLLPWVDLETTICDFKVMFHSGRYYVGQHLAALREEINEVKAIDKAGFDLLDWCWAEAIPAPWDSIAPGIDMSKRPVYRATGVIINEP